MTDNTIARRVERFGGQIINIATGKASSVRELAEKLAALLARPDLLVLDDVAGLLDEENRERVRRVIEREGHIAIIEATVDTPLLTSFTRVVRP